MNLASHSHTLELNSQTELLDRLDLLTNFGSNLVTVSGNAGAGKSWLAKRYLEIAANDKNQCLLICHPNQDEAQHRAQILSQIVSTPSFSTQDTLFDSLESLLEGEGCDIAIVVDDAHLLSENLVTELWMLVLAAQSNPSWSINVLLFANSATLEPLLTRLGYGQEHKPVDLEIELLSESEATEFFETLVVRYLEPTDEKRVRAAFRKVMPMPGSILALGDMKVEKRIIIRSIVGSPLNIALVVLLLALLAAGGYWWMLSQSGPKQAEQEIIATLEQTAIPTLNDTTSNSDSDETLTPLDDLNSQGAPDFDGAVDDSASLPPDVINDTVSVGDNNADQQRVIIESDVVDALLEEKPLLAAQEVDTSNIEQVVAENTEMRPVAVPPVVDAPVSKEETQEPADTVSEQEQATKIVTFSFAREELKAVPARSYTLQLAAMTSMQDVESFLTDYDLHNQVRIYPTVRNDVEWFIITYQDYATIQLARDAVSSLPPRLQVLGPWAKSLRQVHREIDRAK